MDPADFYAPWEQSFDSLDGVEETLSGLFDKWVREHGRSFAWRGVTDASWSFHSSLYRRVLWTKGGEKAPTRLIDVSMNAYIGLWFAVQPVFKNGLPVPDETDGRLFAVDITNRLINEDAGKRAWEEANSRPWDSEDADWQKEWCKETWAWRPPPFERRIAAQNGAFLFGGVPRTGIGRTWPKASAANSGTWTQDAVRRCVSVPIRFHVAKPKAGGVPPTGGQPAYTFRIAASAKQEIRQRLETLFGYEHATIYPDFPGFAQFGLPHLRTIP